MEEGGGFKVGILGRCGLEGGPEWTWSEEREGKAGLGPCGDATRRRRQLVLSERHGGQRASGFLVGRRDRLIREKQGIYLPP